MLAIGGLVLGVSVEKALQPQLKGECAFNYGKATPCCGQAYDFSLHDAALHTCTVDKPVCSGYVKDKVWGMCVTTECAFDFGTTLPCCGQQYDNSKYKDSTIHTCPSETPVCNGYVQDKLWGTCSVATVAAAFVGTCAFDYGNMKPCCGQDYDNTKYHDMAVHICPLDKPVCTGYVQDKTWGTCSASKLSNSTRATVKA